MSKKRHREPPNVDVQLVEIYEDLANEDEEIRLKAAQSLVSKLSPENLPTSEQVEKALNRLLRGLSSGRKAARLGFSIALTEILSQLLGPDRQGVPGLDFSIGRVLEILNTQTRPEGNVSGQEERDHHFGRLFGSEAIIKSLILFNSSESHKHWRQILDLIYELAEKKPWLREECGWIIYEAIQLLARQVFDPSYAQMVIDQLCSNRLAKTPDGISIWLSVQSSFPTVKLPKGVWHEEDPLHIKGKSALAKVLKEASESKKPQNGSEGSRQKGMWTSKLHFAWDIVLASFFERHSQLGLGHSNPPKRLNFVDFWFEIIDNNLFSASASEERKYWGFLLFSKVIREAPQHLIATVFSPNLMRSLLNQLALPERYLHRIAQKALRAVLVRVEAQPDTALMFVSGLMGSNGAINFDQATKTKTIEKLLSQASVTALRQIIALFEDFILQPGVVEEKGADSRRQLLADQLLCTVRSRRSEEVGLTRELDITSWIEQIMFVFAKFGYFTFYLASNELDKSPKPPFSKASQSLFRSRITSCLVHLISTPEGANFPYFVVRNIRMREGGLDVWQSLFQADDNVRQSVNRAWKTLEKVHAKESRTKHDKRAYLQAFKLLYSLTILQVYNGDSDSVLVLDELKTCYDSLVKHSSANSDEASELLVEVLLSFVSKPSVLFRRLSEQVFTTFITQINAAGLQAMVKVLETKENLAGQQEIFDQEDDIVDEDENDDISDVEEVNGNDTSDAATSDDNEEPESDGTRESPDNSDAGDDNDELAAFDAKLAEALDTRRADDGMNGENDDESSDEDMNDEEMEALDMHLENVFKERKKVMSKKVEKKDAKETIVNFKIRVLELLQIYVKQQHTNPLGINLLLPLLILIRTTTSKQVSEKACNVIREYARLCKGKALPITSDEHATWDLLRNAHKEAMRGGSHAHTNACSQSSLLLVKILVGLNEENIKDVIDVYANTRKQQFLDKRCKVQSALFSDWNNCPSFQRIPARPRAWVLGDKLGISAFKDQAMTQLLDEYASSSFFGVGGDIVEYVYTHTTATSKLRMPTADVVAHEFKTMQTSAAEYAELFAQGGEFVTDLMGIVQTAFEQNYQGPLEKRGKYQETPKVE
ncbi:MAG: DNA-directed DNA polymerase [Pleopsidium flavum]|nr:MAG: DNA-directed DNA polymerase [Pleopsidium flavum]